MDEALAPAMEALQACIVARDRDAAERVLDDEYELALITPSRAVMPRHRWLEVLENYVNVMDGRQEMRRPRTTGSQAVDGRVPTLGIGKIPHLADVRCPRR